jgi:hypothetical protein
VRPGPQTPAQPQVVEVRCRWRRLGRRFCAISLKSPSSDDRRACGNIKPEMTRRLAQILTVLTMMASVINAQCVASCSILSLPGQQAIPARGRAVHRQAHACCPHGSSNTRQQPDNPCGHSATRADEAGMEFRRIASVVVVPVLLPFGVSLRLSPVARGTSVEVRRISNPPGQLYLSSFAVLRV